MGFCEKHAKVFEKRKMRKIVSKHGVKPLSEAITMLKVVILAMCFETDITFVISELKAKASLREAPKQVYSRSVCGYGVENRKRRLWKAKERKNDNNWRYHQFDGGY